MDMIDTETDQRSESGGDAQPPHQSATLAALDPSLRPGPEIACASCPTSIWFVADGELRCYCRTLYIVTWRATKPLVITMCDGREQPGM